MCRVFFCCRTSPLPFTFSTVCLFVFPLFVLDVFHFVLASSSTLFFFRLSRQLKYPLIYSNTSLLERVQREIFHVVTRCLTPLMSDASCSCVYRLVLVYKILFIQNFLVFHVSLVFHFDDVVWLGVEEQLAARLLVDDKSFNHEKLCSTFAHSLSVFWHSAHMNSPTLWLCLLFFSLLWHFTWSLMPCIHSVYSSVGGLSVGVNWSSRLRKSSKFFSVRAESEC